METTTINDNTVLDNLPEDIDSTENKKVEKIYKDVKFTLREEDSSIYIDVPYKDNEFFKSIFKKAYYVSKYKYYRLENTKHNRTKLLKYFTEVEFLDFEEYDENEIFDTLKDITDEELIALEKSGQTVVSNKRLLYDVNTDVYLDVTYENDVESQGVLYNKIKFIKTSNSSNNADHLVFNGFPGRKKDKKIKNYVKPVSAEFVPETDHIEFKHKLDDSRTVFNLFDVNKSNFKKVDESRFEITAQREGYLKSADLSDMCPHVDILFNNLFGKDKEYAINWFATIANTRKKLQTTMILAGVQGAGKGLLTNQLIKPLVGEDYYGEFLSDMVEGQFNGGLANKLFVNFNEIDIKFENKSSVANKLKNWITDDTININVKYGQNYAAANKMNIIFSTQNKDAIKIENGDRRYSVFFQDLSLRDYLSDLKIGITPSEFKDLLIKERDDFYKFLGRYKFNEALTSVPLINEQKKAIVGTTDGDMKNLISNLKSGNFIAIKDSLELLEDLTDQVHEKLSDSFLNEFSKINNTLNILSEEMKIGRVGLKTLKSLHILLVSRENTSAMDFNKKYDLYFGITKKSGSLRYKVLNKKYSPEDEIYTEISEDFGQDNKIIEATSEEVITDPELLRLPIAEGECEHTIPDHKWVMLVEYGQEVRAQVPI